MQVKCQICGKSIDRSTAYKVVVGGTNKYFCSEEEPLPGEEKPATKPAKPVDEKDPNGAERCAKIKEVFNAKRKAKELTTDTQKAIKKLLVENSEDGAGMLNENYSARGYDQLEELLGMGE